MLLKFSSSSPEILSYVEVSVNSVIVKSNNNTFTCDIPLGQNLVSIILHDPNLLLNTANYFLNIDLLTIQNIDLTHQIKSLGIYETISKKQKQTYGYMDEPGTLTFSFISPAFYYLRNLNLIKN